MKHWRLAAGILLMICAISGLVAWELWGREAVLTAPYLAARHLIPANQVVQTADFTTIGLTEKNRMAGALTERQLAEVVGLAARRDIPVNSQVSRDDFSPIEFVLAPGQSIYLLRPEWIGMQSSSLRRGDQITILKRADGQSLGCYRVAFVKDEQGVEVRDGNLAGEPTAAVPQALDRVGSTGVIDHVEIIADQAAYTGILRAVAEPPEGQLLLVQTAGSAEEPTGPAGKSATGPAGKSATDPAGKSVTDPAGKNAADPAGKSAADPAEKEPTAP